MKTNINKEAISFFKFKVVYSVLLSVFLIVIITFISADCFKSNSTTPTATKASNTESVIVNNTTNYILNIPYTTNKLGARSSKKKVNYDTNRKLSSSKLQRFYYGYLVKTAQLQVILQECPYALENTSIRTQQLLEDGFSHVLIPQDELTNFMSFRCNSVLIE